MLIKRGSCCLVAARTIWTVLLILLIYNFNNFRRLTYIVLYLQAHLSKNAQKNTTPATVMKVSEDRIYF
jgi:hypothetical protein